MGGELCFNRTLDLLNFLPTQFMDTLKKLTTLVTFGFLAVSASAITFTDVDVDGNNGEPHWVFLKQNGTQHWTNTFNLLDAGFDPLTMRIISATVSFAFADDSDSSKEYADVFVNGEKLWDHQEVDGNHNNSPFSYDWYSTSLNSAAIAQLQDGLLDYSVARDGGDFYLKEASITVEADYTKVPDSGTTLAMFGLGVASLIILRRQMKKNDA